VDVESSIGIVRTEITLKNMVDVSNAQEGKIKDAEIRQTTVTAAVDTGVVSIVINEAIRQALGLKIREKRRGILVDGTEHDYFVTESVSVHWKNRDSLCKALVLPNTDKVLLGIIPLEEMDLIVHPAKLELVGAHGDEIMHMLY